MVKLNSPQYMVPDIVNNEHLQHKHVMQFVVVEKEFLYLIKRQTAYEDNMKYIGHILKILTWPAQFVQYLLCMIIISNPLQRFHSWTIVMTAHGQLMDSFH